MKKKGGMLSVLRGVRNSSSHVAKEIIKDKFQNIFKKKIKSTEKNIKKLGK